MKKLFTLILIAALLCAAFCGCDKEPVEEPVDSVFPSEPIQPDGVPVTGRNCGVLSISLPENLVEEEPGTLYADREALVSVKIYSEYKEFYRNMSLEDYAQKHYNSIPTEASPVLSFTDFDVPSLSWNGPSYYLDTYMNCAALHIFYETNECFIQVIFSCLPSEFNNRYAEFKEWISSIDLFAVANSAAFSGEKVWDFFDLTLHLDSSFGTTEDTSDYLSLTNYAGDWILISRAEKKSSDQEKNLWQCYNSYAKLYPNAEMLSDGTISMEYSFNEGLSFKAIHAAFETDRYWYYINFSAPQGKFYSRVKQFEQWLSAVELTDKPVLTKAKGNASVVTQFLHKDLFGSEPAEISQVFENDQIAISIAKMAEDKCAIYAAENVGSWQAMQILNYERLILSRNGNFLGYASKIGDYVAVFVNGISTEVSDTLATAVIDIPDCDCRLLIIPNAVPSGYKLTIQNFVFAFNGGFFENSQQTISYPQFNQDTDQMIYESFFLRVWKNSDGYVVKIPSKACYVRFDKNLTVTEEFGVSAITNTDFESWIGLTEEEIINLLGPIHFDNGSGLSIPSYIASDGTIFFLHFSDNVVSDVGSINIATYSGYQWRKLLGK